MNAAEQIVEALLEGETVESALAAIGAQVAGHEVKEGYVELQVFVPTDFVISGIEQSIQLALQPFALHKVYVLPQEAGYFKVAFTPNVTEALLEAGTRRDFLRMLGVGVAGASVAGQLGGSASAPVQAASQAPMRGGNGYFFMDYFDGVPYVSYNGTTWTRSDGTGTPIERPNKPKAKAPEAKKVPLAAPAQGRNERDLPMQRMPESLDEASAPEWVQQRMSARVAAGWNPRWPFVPVDLYNPGFREAIQSDPELSDAEKQQILSFAPGGKNERSLFGESVIVESLLGDEADVAVQEFANTVENYAEEVFTELTGISGPNEGDESEPAVAVHGGVCSTKSAEAIQTFLAGLIDDFKLTDRVIHLDVYLDPEAGQCPKKLGKFYSFSVFFKRLPPPERPHEISFAESIAVDLDGTLARDNGWKGPEHIGKPIKPMLDLVQKLLDDGEEVVIFTARCHDGKSSTKDYVKQWLKDNGLPDLEVTNEKRPDMEKFYDDKAVEVETNKGVSA